MNVSSFLRVFLVFTSYFCAAVAQAQFRVDVVGVGLTQVPIAISDFPGESQLEQKISSIVHANLNRSGLFRSMQTANFALGWQAKPDWSIWRERQVDALVGANVDKQADGRYQVKAQLWDVVTGQSLGVFEDVATALTIRVTAHQMSDWIFKQLTGLDGAFDSRLTYITKQSGTYKLWITDADGYGSQLALSSPYPVISPKWSPTGEELVYVSFESGKPVIYLHEIRSGKRRVLANFKGSNSAPAWSPDGRSLVASLSLEGGSQLYSLDLNNLSVKRLMHSTSIDTEPVFSADGQLIYFVSDRGGTPQIYSVPVSGGRAQRVTFDGDYNISPALSPDGRWLAYIGRIKGDYRVHLMDLKNGQIRMLSTTHKDETPSFSPNSQSVVYASKIDGQDVLITSSVDGRVKNRLSSSTGSVREPHWGPFRR